MKSTKGNDKKIVSNKLIKKGETQKKENKPRKKLALLGLNKLNSARNTQLLNKKKDADNDIDIEMNKIYNNNLIKSTDINANINKSEINKRNKIQIFHIDKVPKEKKEKLNAIQIQSGKEKNKELCNYQYLDFNFTNSQENISFAGEYLEEIYMNLLLEEKEATIKPKIGYMENQGDMNEKVRAILIDWIINIHLHFNLRQETLFMTIWLIDTYLSFAFVPSNKLQLLGISCLLISCKSHEIYYPQHHKLIDRTDNAFTKEELLTMENEILKKLNFFIVCPNPIDFYNILSKMFNFEKKQYFLGNYFIEYALINYHILKYSASVIASSCVYLVMKYFRLNGYQKLYNNFIVNEISPEDIIKDAAKEIYTTVEKFSKSIFKSVKNKFSLSQFEKVSEIL